MTLTTEVLVAAFTVLIIGVALPLRSGVRSALILALIVLCALTALGGGMQYLLSYFQ
jgi:hypothetical protein